MRKRMLSGALVTLGLFSLVLTVGLSWDEEPNPWLSSDPVPPGMENPSPPDQPAVMRLNSEPEPETASPPGNRGESKATLSSSDAILPGAKSLSPPDRLEAVGVDNEPEPGVVTSPGSWASDPVLVLR